MTTVRSNSSGVSVGWWVATSVVCPASLRSRMSRVRMSTPKKSSPAVGSSRSRIGRFRANASERANFSWLPVDSLPWGRAGTAN